FEPCGGEVWQALAKGMAGWSRKCPPPFSSPNWSRAMPARKKPTSLRSGFAKRITVAWRKTLKSILEVGHLLLAAKKQLRHGQFEAMIEADLPFKLRTAECLMAIARHPRLSKSHTCALLPTSWRALYELSRLSGKEFDAAVGEGHIHAEMTVDDASDLVQAAEWEAEDRRRNVVTPDSVQPVPVQPPA